MYVVLTVDSTVYWFAQVNLGRLGRDEADEARPLLRGASIVSSKSLSRISSSCLLYGWETWWWCWSKTGIDYARFFSSLYGP